MTPAERDNPKLIDGSRRARISKGSGTQVSDVNGLVDRFFEARKMMQQMAKGGGMPGMPGMPGVPGAGGGKRSKARQPKKAKGKNKRGSGNPAKRAAQQRAAAQKQSDQPAESPFGVPGGKANDPAENFELPEELRDRLPAFQGQPDKYVVWGEGTTDEMCLGILLVTRP